MSIVLNEVFIESGQPMEWLLQRSLGWLNVVYKLITKKKMHEYKLKTMFSRLTQDSLENFDPEQILFNDENAVDFRKQKNFDVRFLEMHGIGFKKVPKKKDK